MPQELLRNQLEPTGIAKFDDMLLGGITKGSTVLIAGQSGAGKTMLCTEWLCRGKDLFDAPGLYISLTEPETKLINNLRQTEYFKEEHLQKGGVRFFDLRGTLQTLGTENRDMTSDDCWKIIDAIGAIVAEHGAQRVIIDSVTALCYRLGEPDLIRSFIFGLGTTLSYLDATVFLISEVSGDKYSIFGVEEFISDGIVKLSYAKDGPISRELQIVKLRGQDFNGHPAKFIITPGGLKLYPQEKEQIEYEAGTERMSSGIAGMDPILGGGYIQGSTVLVSGPSGAGKSIMCQQLVHSLLVSGKKCLYVSFEESRSELLRCTDGFGWNFAKAEKSGSLAIVARSPAEDYLEAHFDEAKRRIETDAIDCVVIDSLSALESTYDIKSVLSAAKRFISQTKSRGVTAIFTAATSSLVGVDSASGMELSTLTDAIVMIRYIEIDSQLHHGVMVIKMRASEHDRRMHEMKFGKDGITITSSFAGYEGVMSGNAHKVNKSEQDQLYSLFLEMLGDRGEKLFGEQMAKGVTRQGLEAEIDRLSRSGEITKDQADQILQRMSDILSD